MQNYSEPVKEEVWAKLFNIFDHYALGNQSITIPVLNQMIRDILKEDGDAEVAYVTRNIAKIDMNHNGLIEFDEFANYLLKRHCGEMTLQKLHRGKVTKGGRMGLSQSDFNQILNNAFQFVSVVVQPETSQKIFQFLDSDDDKLVTYTEYFRFIEAFICQTSLSLSENQNRSRGSPHKITRPIEHSEMLILFRRLLWGQLFKIYIRYDEDGNGNMDQSQMKEVLKEVLNETTQSQLDYVFKNAFRMDLNGDNNFVFQQFAHFFIKHSCEVGLNRYNRSRPSGGRRDINSHDFVKLFRNSFCFLDISIMTDKLVNKVFNKIDKDHDGIISYKEYLMWSNQLLHYREKCGMPCFLSDPKVEEMAKTTPRKGNFDDYDVSQVSKFQLDRQLENSRASRYKQDRENQERERYERQLKELERMEKEKHDRIEREKQQVYRNQYEKQQKQKLERERQERERVERARSEMERYERDRREKQQRDRERVDKNRKQRFEDMRSNEEKENENERLMRQDSMRREKQARDKRHWILDQQQRLQREKRAAMSMQAKQREKQQRERQERQRAEREKREREQRERLQKQERQKKERQYLQKIEKQRNERQERERIERARIEKERQDRERQERQRLQQKRLQNQRLEQQRRDNLKNEQLRYGNLNEKSMNEQRQDNQRSQNERQKQRLEAQRLEYQRLEQQRLENQRLQQLRIDQHRQLQRLEQEKLDNQRIQNQRIERQRLLKQKSERERLERQRLEQKIHEQKLQNQRLEQQRLQQQRYERERFERDRAQRQRLERERQENQRQERQRQERQRQQRLEKQRIERERQQQQIAEKNQRQWERYEKQRVERDRLEAERVQRERTEREKASRERRERERQDLQRQERERTRSIHHQDGSGSNTNNHNTPLYNSSIQENEDRERRARAATMSRPPLPQHTARQRLNMTIDNVHEQSKTQRAYSTSKLVDFNLKGCQTVVLPSIRVNGSRITNIPRLNISGRNFDTSSIASSGCSVRSFSAKGLAERIKEHTRRLFKTYDLNHNELAERSEIIEILRSILKEDELQLSYVTRNFSRINWAQGQKIQFQTFLQFFLGLHCGQMAIQRFHRKEMFTKGQQQVMCLKQFIMVFQGALDYLQFLAPNKQLKQLFRQIDNDGDGLITYKEYFSFLTHFFGFLPPSTMQIIKKYPQLIEKPMSSRNQTPANSQRMSDDEPTLEQTIGSLIKNQTSAMLNQYAVGMHRIFTRKSVQKFFRQVIGLTQNEIHYCIQNFNSYDGDLDGSLTNQQLTMMVLKLYCSQMVLEKLHASGKLKRTKERILSLEDFVLLIETAFSYLFFRPRKEDLALMFKNMDTKHVGYIPYSHYGQFIEKYMLMERFDGDSSVGFTRERKTTQATSPGGNLASSYITSQEDREERRPLLTTRSTFLKM